MWGQGTPNRPQGQAFFVGLKINRAKQRIPFDGHPLRKMARASASAGFMGRLQHADRAIIVGLLATYAHPPSLPSDHRYAVALGGKNVKTGLQSAFISIVCPSAFPGAGVAQLVEHHLAKVTVESSSLFTRSILFLKINTQFTLR